jgi:hydrogenase maturation protease
MGQTPTILIAGIGNIFLGDDGFGSEVARRLVQRNWPAGVKVGDFGIRGLDLVYALADGYDLAILIDAMPRGGQPGTLYTFEPDLNDLGQSDAGESLIDGHSMDPVKVLRLARGMGGLSGRVLVVGCEPADLGGEEGRFGLTDAVRAVLDEACRMVESLVGQFLNEHPATVP